MKLLPCNANPGGEIARLTEARLGLGRVGASTPTAAVLDFTMAHARARDAIRAEMAVEESAQELEAAGFGALHAQSKAGNRTEYLRRPDLGRMLDEASIERLKPLGEVPPKLLTVVVADGLSAMAPRLNAVPLLKAIRRGLVGWTLDVVIIATQARVAIGDQIGELRGAEAVIILIGERAGLRSFDSLGAYLTYRPRIGRMDAERNCVSNIRAAGLTPEQAAAKLLDLLSGAVVLGASGVRLKERSSLFAELLQ